MGGLLGGVAFELWYPLFQGKPLLNPYQGGAVVVEPTTNTPLVVGCGISYLKGGRGFYEQEEIITTTPCCYYFHEELMKKEIDFHEK